MGRVIVGSIALAIGVVLIAVAAFSYLGKLADVSMADESSDWPSVAGIVAASFVKDSGPTPQGRGRAGGFAGPGREFWPQISYRYNVENRDYESDRIAFGNIRTSAYEPAKDIADRYPADQAAEIFYDPSDPAQAVLIQGGDPSVDATWPIGLAIAGLVFGVIAVSYFNEARKHQGGSIA